MAAIILNRLTPHPEDSNTHLFSFIFEHPYSLVESRVLESSDVNYGGHRWSLVFMRKEEKYAGVYLKWRYSDGPSATAVSCKLKYKLAIVHRSDYARTKTYSTTQKFSKSQSLHGRSKLITLNDLLDQASGYMDDVGKRVVVELQMASCSTCFERKVDTSPTVRTKKNSNGYYFDTSTFVFSNFRWYIRVYPAKTKAGGLPSVYLYMSDKPKGVSVHLQFRLYMDDESTDYFTYTFGESAKFDGFGRTLTAAFEKPSKVLSLTVGVEIASVIIFKDVFLSLHPGTVYSPHLYNNYGASSLTPSEAFQDHDGNHWKAEIDLESKRFAVTLDKAVHHFPQNITKLACWSATLLSRSEAVEEMDMCADHAIVSYFSNSLDERGYIASFPIELAELREKGCPYVHEDQIVLHVELHSVQTIPVNIKALPRFDFQFVHLLKARHILANRHAHRSLDDLRDDESLTSSRLDLLSSSMSEDSGHSHHRNLLIKSFDDSLDIFSLGNSIDNEETDEKSVMSDLLRHLVEMHENNQQSATSEVSFCTSRNTFSGMLDDVNSTTESGITVSDESNLLIDARPNTMDIQRQQGIISAVSRFIKEKFPVKVTGIIECGSLGFSTSTKSRLDVDLIVLSRDVPQLGHRHWMPAFLTSVSKQLQRASGNKTAHPDLPNLTDFSVSSQSVQFQCCDIDIDVSVAFDWEAGNDQRLDGLYDVTLNEPSVISRQWFSPCTARLQKRFICDQPTEVKDIIKVVKHWRNCVQWKKTAYRPNSYLLSLLVIKAADSTKQQESYDFRLVLQKFSSYVMAHELVISWKAFYLPEKYPVEFEPPTPVVRDPTNPGINVAASLSYWGQFKTEVNAWMKALAITV